MQLSVKKEKKHLIDLLQEKSETFPFAELQQENYLIQYCTTASDTSFPC